MELSKFEKWVPQTMKRSDIKEAPVNPRFMSKAANRKLLDNIRSNGIIEPPKVNGNTMCLVGGHQTLGCVDELQKYDPTLPETDYLITVAMSRHTDSEASAAVLQLNSRGSQGLFEKEAVEGVWNTFREDKGFQRAINTTAMELDTLVGTELSTLFKETSAEKSMLDAIENDLPPEIEKPPKKKKERSAQERAKAASERAQAREDTENYFVVSFESLEAKRSFQERNLLLPDDEVDMEFYDSHRFIECMKRRAREEKQ